MDTITFPLDSFYILDKGYTDFKRLHRIQVAKAFFVICAKDNLHFKCIKSLPKDKNAGVLADQIIQLQGYYAFQDYPDKIRRIKFYDPEYNRTLVFLTNNLEFKATDIALLYKHRWKIELFFNG
ncbi:MAG: hypothetical protein NVS1B13_11410 [Flavisolibacter sp.]